MLRSFLALCSSLVVFNVPVFLPLVFPQQVLAIPKEEAISKLNLITTYVVVNQDDDFFTVQEDDFSVVSIFLGKSDAQKFLSNLIKSDRKLKPRLKKFSLDQLLPLIESTQGSSLSQKILFPIVNLKENTDKAYELLRIQGISKKNIAENLRVPVFYSEPMVNMTIDKVGTRQFFFLDYGSLASALAKMPPGLPKPKLKVLNLDQVLDLIVKEKKDLYYIYPNKQYLLEQ